MNPEQSKLLIERSFLKDLSEKELKEKIKNDARFGLIFNDDTLCNHFTNIPSFAHENFSEYICSIMSRPEYYYFIIKYIFGMKSYPLQCMILHELATHTFPILMGSRGLAKTTALAMYILIKMIVTPGIKCVITGAGFRQAKIVFEMMESIWGKSPMLRNCFKGGKNGPHHGTDAWSFRIGHSICWALPVGHDGHKVRGFRANLLACDEFATLPRAIFEEVMGGFLSVNNDPVTQIDHFAYLNAAANVFNLTISEEDKELDVIQNQMILSGTAYYKHNHFYHYFSKWRSIIRSGGKFENLKHLFKDEEEMSRTDYRKFSIIRIPVGLITEGFMDMTQIGRLKASVNNDVYLREFEAVFSNDSDGFFRRSLIDFCSLSSENTIKKNNQEVKFSPVLYGNMNKKHVFGVDPAYQGDNFAIVILEINENYRGVVYCWTIQASEHKQRLKDAKENGWGIDIENQYYDYCARKIRSLMKRFPCAYIVLDPEGGGRTIMESLADPSKLKENEELILPVIDTENKPTESDFIQGEHIIYQFKNTPAIIGEANHALKKDMESRDLIFPYHDGISFAEAQFYDNAMGEVSTLYDTLEDCVADIEELKNELSTIAISETSTGKEHFDTPDVKNAAHKKGRLRKDRYSALLMANYIARSAENLVVRHINSTTMIETAYFNTVDSDSPMFMGNNKIARQLNELYK